MLERRELGGSVVLERRELGGAIVLEGRALAGAIEGRKLGCVIVLEGRELVSSAIVLEGRELAGAVLRRTERWPASKFTKIDYRLETTIIERKLDMSDFEKRHLLILEINKGRSLIITIIQI